MRTRKEIVLEMQGYLKGVYRCGDELGHDNILEKAKWKEEIMGMILDDTVFTKSTGEVKGADARNNKSGEVREYKTEELKTESDKKRCTDLLKDPRYQDGIWKKELEVFLKIQKKAELEAFSKYGLTNITDKYLPEKLELANSL